ncbi:hypothetical protein GX51_00816 [Blastomyces parvus]|uniref:Uncharacterized protein n=1 Tax=Blastomyces parvus TaxID=2060905 RepID=A0A2B7XJV8_9EURO|nr:hypothetical protein GX51_00816 [Blastomyces parvus]
MEERAPKSQFWYEKQDPNEGMRWKLCYGIEHWTFEAEGEHAGIMRMRVTSGSGVFIGEKGG